MLHKFTLYDYHLSYHVILKEFKKDDIISPIAHKKAIKFYAEKMKNTTDNLINEQKIELYRSRIIEIEKAHIRG